MKRRSTPTDPRKVCIAAAQRFDSQANLARDNGEPTAYLRELSARLREVAKMHTAHATAPLKSFTDPREVLIDELAAQLDALCHQLRASAMIVPPAVTATLARATAHQEARRER